MVVDDLAANGIEPTGLSNILDVDHLEESTVDLLMKGLHDAALAAGIAVTGGEIAELGDRISGWGDGMHFNWCATAIGILPPYAEPIDGTAVRPGDHVIALRSAGFRSNGFSLVRRVMQQKHGDDWHQADCDGRTWGEVLLTPSRIYAGYLSNLAAAGTRPSGIAHVTGGGIAGNLARVLAPTNLGAHLDNLFLPHEFMARLQQLGDIPDRQAYELWNMGNGMLLVTSPPETEAVLEAMERADVEARVAGIIMDKPGIEIATKTAGEI